MSGLWSVRTPASSLFAISSSLAMSQDDSSPKDSQSESSNSSPNAVYMLRSEKEVNDLILFGASSTRHHRSATVRRASLKNKEGSFARSQDDLNVPVVINPERYRRSLDSTYRQSLESISEYKTKKSFSSTASLGYKESIDSTCSDCTDYATRSSSDLKDDYKAFPSPCSATYLSWIESLNNEHFANQSAISEVVDVDSKVGEWNNFWLNYNNPNNRYLSSPYLCTSNEDKTGDDISDCKSTCSTQREFNEKLSSEHIILTLEEVQEALHCSQKIVDILQRAMKRTDNDTDLFVERSRQDSYYSQQTNSFDDRSFSFAIDPQELQKQKNLLKPPAPPQPPTNSCINVLFNSGVADILKRVINKRREVLAPEEVASTARSSFSEWTSGAK